ncbi:MAG: M23 family metallopeptidase [Rikenellaceae bacterium]
MKFINITKHLILNFNKKLKLSIYNINLKEEIWSIFISPLNIFFGFITILLVLVAVLFLLITNTVLFDIIPGYPGNKSREVLLQSVVKLDSMERALKNWETYESNITAIMNGKTPVSLTASNTIDSLGNNSIEDVPTSDVELSLREEIENDEDAKNRAREEAINKQMNSFNLFTPLQGVITQYFNPSNKQFGIEISAYTSQEVMATNNGVVILNEWLPTSGFMLQIQHSGNMVSTYKNLSSSIKQVGDRVNGGEVIGFVGVEDAYIGNIDMRPTLLFELWSLGTPVDPLNYVLF